MRKVHGFLAEGGGGGRGDGVAGCVCGGGGGGAPRLSRQAGRWFQFCKPRHEAVTDFSVESRSGRVTRQGRAN